MKQDGFSDLGERAEGWAGLLRVAEDIWIIPEQSTDDRATASQESPCGLNLIGDRTGDRPLKSLLDTPKALICQDS